MNLLKILSVAAIALLLLACGAPKVLTSSKTDATEFESKGNFDQAIVAWQQYFDQTNIEETSGEDFASAAKTAYKAGKPAKAKSWFDQARYKNFADAGMYEILAEIYQSEDNLSKELSALEFYVENYGSTNSKVNARLFSIYSEIGSNEKALEQWAKLDAISKNEEQLLNAYFLINRKLENTEVCDSVSLELLKLNANNVDALEWNAKKFYWAGQNRYKREMQKYEQNKTTKSYKVLLKELDIVTADFKSALPYLDKLWELSPGKEYAAYYANIYALFGDEKKTNYYKNYLN